MRLTMQRFMPHTLTNYRKLITSLRMENKNYYYLISCIVAVIIVAMVAMMCRTASRFMFSIQSFDLNTREVTVGANSGIAFDKVPHDFMTIKQEDNHYAWSVNPRYMEQDSLVYYKVNNVNPNFHLIGDGSVTVNVPLENGTSSRVTLTSEEVQSLLSGPDSKYLLLRTLLQMHAQRDSTSNVDYTAIKRLRSCFARAQKDSPWGIIILDRYTSYNQSDGVSHTYVMSGRTDSIEGSKVPAENCKIQFYRMTDYSIRPDKADDELFHIGLVHYIAKPVLVTTQWGAGHVMLTPTSDGMHVAYPKAITYIERIDSLRSDAAASSGMLTYQQNDGSFPVARNLLLPAYSSALARDACSMRITADTLAVVTGPEQYMMIKSKARCLPGFDRLDIPAGTGTLHTQVGVIGNHFVLSYLWLPLLVFAILVVAYHWLMNTRGISSNIKQDMPVLTKNLPAYFSAIFTIALAFAVARIMIAFRLSYSYPYFEKLTGIITVSITLILILVYVLSLVFNYKLVRQERHGRKPMLRLIAAPAIPFFCLALTWGAFMVLDHGISAAMLSSYFPSELGGYNPLCWTKALAMNDNHRTVPFTLALVNLLAMAVLAFLLNAKLFKNNCVVKWGKKTIEGAVVKIKNSWLMTKCTIVVKVKAFFAKFKPYSKYLNNLVIGCGLVLLASILPGNYSTAIITLIAILGLTRTLLSINYYVLKYKRPSRLVGIVGPKAFWLAIIACMCYFVSAFALGDKGYLTNLLGYLSMGIIVYILAAKTEIFDRTTSESEVMQVHRRGIGIAILISAVLVILAIKLLPVLVPVDTIDYSRKDQRINAAMQTSKYYDSGYRYAVSNQEFMLIQNHYMFNLDGSDPLSNTQHILHPSLSSDQSPVILNDVSIQSSFFGCYGTGAVIVFFTLLCLLTWLVLSHTLNKKGGLSKQRLWRLMAILLWMSTTVYLYVSYSGLIPFTGRLVPGYGVDAVGEALETSILLAFMTAVPLKETINRSNNQFN